MKKIKLGLSLVVVAGLLWLGHESILTALASYLVQAESPRKAEVAIVLGGDLGGDRAAMGCDLLKRGIVDRIWFSSSQAIFGHTESEMAKEWAAAHGCDPAKMTALHADVDSTGDEARSIALKLKSEGIHSYLLVTSNFHTRRAGNLFRRSAPGIEQTVVAAADDNFPVDRWWKDRRTRKTFAYEWLKTVTNWFGV